MTTPDFEQIARTVADTVAWHLQRSDQGRARLVIAEQLLLTWNARGAADAQAATNELDSDTAAYVSVAIKEQDR